MNRTQLYAKARRALADGDAASWAAADAMRELYDMGETQTAIAAQLGCSQSVVSEYIRTATSYEVGKKKRPPFTEAQRAIRGGWGNDVPKSPEKRAALAAELLKDKHVSDNPIVRKVEDRNENRRLKQEAAEWNREHGIRTRTQRKHDLRAEYVTINRSFWRGLLADARNLTRVLNDGVGELERTGMPNGEAGEIIKAARTLAKAADRFAETAAGHGIGKAMTR